MRAVVKDKPIDPQQVRSYLERAYGDDLPAVVKAMEQLAKSLKPDRLTEQAFGLYERFRPKIEGGKRGWGQKGKLDLGVIRSLGRSSRRRRLLRRSTDHQ